MPLENPFRSVPPKELDPNQEEFLRKFGGADDEGLKAAGITGNDERRLVNNETVDGELPVEGLGEHATPEEREAFLDAIVEFKGTQIMRRDLMALESIFKQLNEDLRNAGQDKVELGEGMWKIGTNEKYSQLIMVEKGRVKRINIDQTPISSLQNITFPDEATFIDLSETNVNSVANVFFPKKLRRLGLIGTPISSLEGFKVPPDLRQLELSNTQISSLDNIELPVEMNLVLLQFTPLGNDIDAMVKLKSKYPKCIFSF